MKIGTWGNTQHIREYKDHGFTAIHIISAKAYKMEHKHKAIKKGKRTYKHPFLRKLFR